MLITCIEQVPLATLHNDLNEYLALLKAKVTFPAMHSTAMRALPIPCMHLHGCYKLRRPGGSTSPCPPSCLSCTQLVEVINDDYGDYVSLSSRLVNVDGFVVRLRKPLVELKVQHPLTHSHLCSRLKGPVFQDPLLQALSAW